MEDLKIIAQKVDIYCTLSKIDPKYKSLCETSLDDFSKKFLELTNEAITDIKNNYEKVRTI